MAESDRDRLLEFLGDAKNDVQFVVEKNIHLINDDYRDQVAELWTEEVQELFEFNDAKKAIDSEQSSTFEVEGLWGRQLDHKLKIYSNVRSAVYSVAEPIKRLLLRLLKLLDTILAAWVTTR